MKRGRKPGSPKTGGRQPGSHNKVTAETKAWITKVIEDNKPKFEQNLKVLEPEKQVLVIERLLSFVVPKPQNLDIQIEYRELEALLQQTPEEYIERISTKILTLNAKNTENETE